MAAHRLYGVFWTEAGRAMWALGRNGRMARRMARLRQGLCVSMVLPAGGGGWDAPTFRACADRIEADYRSGPHVCAPVQNTGYYGLSPVCYICGKPITGPVDATDTEVGRLHRAEEA